MLNIEELIEVDSLGEMDPRLPYSDSYVNQCGESFVKKVLQIIETAQFKGTLQIPHSTERDAPLKYKGALRVKSLKVLEIKAIINILNKHTENILAQAYISALNFELKDRAKKELVKLKAYQEKALRNRKRRRSL